MAETKAYRKATGIARFPDGGQSLVFYYKRDLFIFSLTDSTRVNVLNLNDLSTLKGHILSSPKIVMCFSDSVLFFRIKPVLNWDSYYRIAHNAEDSANIEMLQKIYKKPFLWDISKNDVWQIDSIGVNPICELKDSLPIMTAYNLVKSVPMESLGFDIMQIYPKSEKDYVYETIYLKNDSRLARKAVVEQIISRLSQKQIRSLLLKMDQYPNSLDDYEKLQYQISSKETYEQIKALLK
ncbi:MAG: hypothetical protein C0599_00480 [Salinivirgaceae bacterium]|nr:MAG: hypothetical protein C0599_00480 [Salinivirgaceae bacterium]